MQLELRMPIVRKRLIIAGALIIALAGAMGVTAACMFTMTQEPREYWTPLDVLAFGALSPQALWGPFCLVLESRGRIRLRLRLETGARSSLTSSEAHWE